jgi:catalase
MPQGASAHDTLWDFVGLQPETMHMMMWLNHVDHELAGRVAEGIGVKPPTEEVVRNHGRGSPALSQANTATDSIRSRKVAVLVADGVESGPVTELADALREGGAIPELLASTDGAVQSSTGQELPVDRALNTMASVLYDAVVVAGGAQAASALSADGYAMHYIAEAARHAKVVAGIGERAELVKRATGGAVAPSAEGDGWSRDHGVLTAPSASAQLPDGFVRSFGELLAGHRVWERSTDAIPA